MFRILFVSQWTSLNGGPGVAQHRELQHAARVGEEARDVVLEAGGDEAGDRDGRHGHGGLRHDVHWGLAGASVTYSFLVRVGGARHVITTRQTQYSSCHQCDLISKGWWYV